MRGFNQNIFSKQYEVTVINKRNIRSINDHNVWNELHRLKPDIIYIHLGINDISDGRPTAKILDDLDYFIKKVLTRTTSKVVYSSVLPSTKSYVQDLINHYNDGVLNICDEIRINDSNRDRLFINHNSNFLTKTENGPSMMNHDMVGRDKVHLNERGTKVIMGNLKFALNSLTQTRK